MTRTGTVAVIPLKSLAAAKGRLSEAMPPSLRRELVRWMFGRAVEACLEASSIRHVLVVAEDPADVELGGVEVLRQRESGLNGALRTADAHVGSQAPSVVLVADLPLIEAGDVDAICGSGGAVVIAPTSDGGTGALYRNPTGVIPTAFGPDSAHAHGELARAAGLVPVVCDRAGFRIDLDTGEDLRAVADRLPAALRGF